MGIILVSQKPPITDSNGNSPRLDVSYFKSLPGILKLTELVIFLSFFILTDIEMLFYIFSGVGFDYPDLRFRWTLRWFSSLFRRKLHAVCRCQRIYQHNYLVSILRC